MESVVIFLTQFIVFFKKEKGKVMLETMPRVRVTLTSFNEEFESGCVETDCGIKATLSASRLRRARLARREQDRIHRLDKRVVPGVHLLVDIERQFGGKAKVTWVHGLGRLPLPVDTTAVGTVTWVPNKSYGFIRVSEVYDENRQLKDSFGFYENVFLHLSEIREDLLDSARIFDKRLIFKVIPSRAQSKIQAKVIGIQE